MSKLYIRDLEFKGLDDFHRPTFQHKETKQYYCLQSDDEALTDVLTNLAELYFKGSTFDNEPEYPVDLQA